MPKIKSSKTRVKSDEPRVKMSENLMKIKFYYIIISYWWCSALRTDFQVKFIKQKRERETERKKKEPKRERTKQQFLIINCCQQIEIPNWKSFQRCDAYSQPASQSQFIFWAPSLPSALFPSQFLVSFLPWIYAWLCVSAHTQNFSKKFVYQNYIIQEYIATSMHMFSLYFECLYLVSVRHIYIYIHMKRIFLYNARDSSRATEKKNRKLHFVVCSFFRSFVSWFVLSFMAWCSFRFHSLCVVMLYRFIFVP